jgi:histidine triad (HIT) family protein
MTDCVFCRIIAGEIPAKILHSTELILAFRDINPAAPSHVLIVPRQHIPDLCAAKANQPELWGGIVKAIQTLSESEGIARDGFRVIINTGAMAGQTVNHLHVHLLGGKEFVSL